MPTEPKIIYEGIDVHSDQPKENEAEGFMLRNAILRSPPQQATRPAPLPEPGIITPPTKYTVPEDVSRAPKKKETKLALTLETLNMLHPSSSSTMIDKERDISMDQKITEPSLALIMDNILAEMQKIHNVFL